VSVIAAAGAAAYDDIIDIGRVEADALLECVQHLRHVSLGMDVRQTALAGLAAAPR
jgi:hypothetical protein